MFIKYAHTPGNLLDAGHTEVNDMFPPPQSSGRREDVSNSGTEAQCLWPRGSSADACAAGRCSTVRLDGEGVATGALLGASPFLTPGAAWGLVRAEPGLGDGLDV